MREFNQNNHELRFYLYMLELFYWPLNMNVILIVSVKVPCDTNTNSIIIYLNECTKESV